MKTEQTLLIMICIEIAELALNCENSQYCYGYISGRIKEIEISEDDIQKLDNFVELIFEGRG